MSSDVREDLRPSPIPPEPKLHHIEVPWSNATVQLKNAKSSDCCSPIRPLTDRVEIKRQST